MKISTQLAYSGDYQATVREAVACEKAGLDVLWVAEAYGFDAISLIGYLAAKTERVTLAAGVLPVYTRTPALMAQTAAGLDAVSNGRFALGLGASGPQVIEGWHGVRYDQPVDYSVSVKDLRLDELKVLAGKSNMTVKQYVETYYNDSIMTPDEV